MEFALLLPLLLLISFGIIEFGRGIDEKHSLATVTREGALLAARGTSLDSVVNEVMLEGGDIKLATRGGAIASTIEITAKGAVVRSQFRSSGFATKSRLGAIGDTVKSLNGLGLLVGTTVYSVEAFFTHTPIVPLAQLYKVAVPATLYEKAVF